jgi:hypothetical protein
MATLSRFLVLILAQACAGKMDKMLYMPKGSKYEVHIPSFQIQVLIYESFGAFDAAKHKDVPTCFSQLYHVGGGTDHYPYVAADFAGSNLELPALMPYPDMWHGWDGAAPGTSACNRDASSVCKTKIVVGMYQSIYSSFLNYLGGGVSPDIYEVSNRWTNVDPKFLPRWADKCTLCVPAECDDASCPNGKVEGSAVQAYNKKVYHRPTCAVACPQGTWLTCEKSLGCTYQAPSTYRASSAQAKREWYNLNVNARKSDLNIVEAWPLPAASCYPCNLADGQFHYGPRTETPLELFEGGFLSFRCPGGDSAPVMCPRNMVTKVDSATGRSGACECMSGYYRKDGVCAMCPPGYRCRWAETAAGWTPPVKEECPLDHYATDGQSECKPCGISYQMCDRSMALTRCLPGENGKFQSRDSHCMTCANCKQVTNIKDSWPCYRVTPAFNSTEGG